MKKLNYLILALLLLGTTSCKNDDDCPTCEICEECEVCEDCEEPIGFKNATVDFFSTHKDFKVQPVVFETVTEQALVRPAHQQGAFFELVTEQYLVKESHLRHKILDSTVIHIVANSEIDSVAEIVCYRFFDEDDILETEVPAEYATHNRYVVVQEGTGAEVPAEYTTLVRQHVVSDSQVLPTTTEQAFQSVNFRIPENNTIEAYLLTQFLQQSVEGCINGSSYRVQN